MTYRVEVYERDGTPIAELDRLHGVRWSYALNKASTAVFDIALNHPKATKDILAMGNVVVIRHDELETWGGYITSPQWATTGDIITINCASVLQRLSLRISDVITFKQKQTYDVFAALITKANAHEHTGVYIGDIVAANTLVDFEMRREKIYDKVQELLEQSKVELRLRYVDPFTWLADLKTKIGTDLTGTVFVQGGYDTIGLPDYTEDLTNWANDVIGVGKLPENFEVPEGEDEYKYRPTYEWKDTTSIGLYGRSEDAVEFDTESASELKRLTQEEVSKRAYPKVTLSFQVNKRRGLWSKFSDGDIIAVQLPKFGYTGVAVPVRVMGREIDDAADSMTVACEVVQGTDAIALDMNKYMHYGTARENPGVPQTYPEG